MYVSFLSEGGPPDVGKMMGGDDKDDKDPEAEKEKEEQRQEALRQEEDERKAKHAKMEAERENIRQGIRDKVSQHQWNMVCITFVNVTWQTLPISLSNSLNSCGMYKKVRAHEHDTIAIALLKLQQCSHYNGNCIGFYGSYSLLVSVGLW